RPRASECVATNVCSHQSQVASAALDARTVETGSTPANRGERMTTKADSTDEEWKQVLEGPTSAGMVVAVAEKGGTFRETFAMAGAYTDARKEHGASELLDEIVTPRPKTGRFKAHSKEELKGKYLDEIRAAVGFVEAKATAQELGDYRLFVVNL